MDLAGLDRVCAAGFGDRAEIIFLISPFERGDRRQMLELGVSAKTFRLGCAPIVNLFSQTAEPILLDHARYEYQVVPDVSRRQAMEVFEIDRGGERQPADAGSRALRAASIRTATAWRAPKRQAFWRAARRPSGRRDDEGTEVFLSPGGPFLAPGARPTSTP